MPMSLHDGQAKFSLDIPIQIQLLRVLAQGKRWLFTLENNFVYF